MVGDRLHHKSGAKQNQPNGIPRAQQASWTIVYQPYRRRDDQHKETLKHEEDAKKIADKILEEKVIQLLKKMVKLDTKTVSIEEFNKLFE